MKLADIMTPVPMTIEPTFPVGKALAMMALRGIRHLPIVENERLVGIVTERDLRAYAASPEVLVGWVMTVDLQIASPDDDVYSASGRMADSRIGSLPVVDEAGRIVGIVTTVDVMTAVARLDRPPEATA